MHPFIARLLKAIGGGLAGLVVVLVVLVLVVVFLPSGSDNLCGNAPFAEVLSPAGNLKAVVFERDCGATTRFSTQVSVIKATNTLQNEGGNLFIADTNHDAAPSGPGGGPAVRVVWLGPSALRIEYHPLAHVIRSEPSANGVKVEYVSTQSAG